jgi:hypothetical protein
MFPEVVHEIREIGKDDGIAINLSACFSVDGNSERKMFKGEPQGFYQFFIFSFGDDQVLDFKVITEVFEEWLDLFKRLKGVFLVFVKHLDERIFSIFFLLRFRLEAGMHKKRYNQQPGGGFFDVCFHCVFLLVRGLSLVIGERTVISFEEILKILFLNSGMPVCVFHST